MHDFQVKYQDDIIEIIDACHRLAELGYVSSAGGNLSKRVGEDVILITPTKTPKRTMRFDDICAVDLNGKMIYSSGEKRPTGETPFHTRILRKRREIKAVVHAHPPIMTGFAIANSDLLAKVFLPEPALEVGPMLMVPYETPVTEALSLQFDKVIEKSNGFLMENHGAVICSTTGVFDAVEKMQMVECMAQSVIVSQLLGNCKTIPANFVSELDQVIEMRDLPVPGIPGKFSSLSEVYEIEDE